jgi:hypothetical protein
MKNHNVVTVWITAFFHLFYPLSGNAQNCSVKSPAHTVALLELYTSEGCSSCPPADKFISQLQQTSGLNSQQVIPLSLHVDYWNKLGWKDVFSNGIFTERQRWLASLASSRTIYTPEFFAAGKELRDWRINSLASIKSINATPAKAQINLQLISQTTTQIALQMDVNVLKLASTKNKLFYVLTENDLSNEIRSGENNGIRLHHDFVARVWGEPIPLTGTSLNTQRKIDLPSNANVKNLSLVAFLQNESGEILQAVSLPIGCKI